MNEWLKEKEKNWRMNKQMAKGREKTISLSSDKDGVGVSERFMTKKWEENEKNNNKNKNSHLETPSLDFNTDICGRHWNDMALEL